MQARDLYPRISRIDRASLPMSEARGLRPRGGKSETRGPKSEGRPKSEVRGSLSSSSFGIDSYESPCRICKWLPVSLLGKWLLLGRSQAHEQVFCTLPERSPWL